MGDVVLDRLVEGEAAGVRLSGRRERVALRAKVIPLRLGSRCRRKLSPIALVLRLEREQRPLAETKKRPINFTHPHALAFATLLVKLCLRPVQVLRNACPASIQPLKELRKTFPDLLVLLDLLTPSGRLPSWDSKRVEACAMPIGSAAAREHRAVAVETGGEVHRGERGLDLALGFVGSISLSTGEFSLFLGVDRGQLVDREGDETLEDVRANYKSTRQRQGVQDQEEQRQRWS